MLAVGEHLFRNLDELCVRMTTSFGGGIGGTHEELCGAFTAGLMIISGIHGRVSHQEDDSLAYALAKTFRQRFADRWCTLRCGPIREAAIGRDESGNCAGVVTETALMLLELLHEV